MNSKVVIIQRLFTSYRKPVYDLLDKKYDLLILHGQNNSGIKTTSASYSQEINSLKYSKNETNVFLNCFGWLRRSNPSIVIHEFAVGILSMPVVYLWCKLRGKKFVLWSHGYNRKKGFHPDKSALDQYRLWMLRKADSIILYGDRDKGLLSNFIPPSKIFVAKNTLNTDELLKIRQEFEKEGRDNLKLRIGFKTKYNFIFIGRLLPDKLPHLLIDLLEFLPGEIAEETTVHFVGDGPAKNDLVSQSQNSLSRGSFKFHGNIYDDRSSGEFLYGSDLMIMPGAVGLSVNHALSFQCPVMTFERDINGPFHGPEEEYITPMTGFKLKNRDAKAIADCVCQYVNNKDQQSLMRREILKYVESELRISTMAQGLMDSIEYTLHDTTY